ncbi:hypothetical protein [Rothia mucilaginosa]|uniref:hypothetical protein n=1 Tax=Rothia mucilaginosa TaxID=43675 RepID=UPI0028D39519|nr:hypothetical protein [Rothia mucilaginosa]
MPHNAHPTRRTVLTGGAGGSYLAPSVRNGAIVGTKEAPVGPNVRVNGMAEVRFK